MLFPRRGCLRWPLIFPVWPHPPKLGPGAKHVANGTQAQSRFHWSNTSFQVGPVCSAYQSRPLCLKDRWLSGRTPRKCAGRPLQHSQAVVDRSMQAGEQRPAQRPLRVQYSTILCCRPAQKQTRDALPCFLLRRYSHNSLDQVSSIDTLNVLLPYHLWVKRAVVTAEMAWLACADSPAASS